MALFSLRPYPSTPFSEAIKPKDQPPFIRRILPSTPHAKSDDGVNGADDSSLTEPDDFEKRLSQVEIKYRRGKGKKAEIRKSKKSGGNSSPKKSLFLPAIPLKEAVSGGLKVELGFSPYSERLNGHLAMLGLAALLLVELGSGKSVMKYHTPSVIFVQVYTMAAASAIFIKYEKEKISIWPEAKRSDTGKPVQD